MLRFSGSSQNPGSSVLDELQLSTDLLLKASEKIITIIHPACDKGMNKFLQVWTGNKTSNCCNVFEMIVKLNNVLNSLSDISYCFVWYHDIIFQASLTISLDTVISSMNTFQWTDSLYFLFIKMQLKWATSKEHWTIIVLNKLWLVNHVEIQFM